MKRTNMTRLVLVALAALMLLAQGLGAMAEADTRWADAADEIDQFLDTAFEDYLTGDADSAYQNVSNAYFRVYETTGFERQTMSYISGNRKNAVEMQFSNCKAAVKKDNAEPETIVSVRSALVKELLDTAYMGYLDKDFTAAADNLETAYYSVYEESGLSHKIYTDLSLKDRLGIEAQFASLRGLVDTAGEKYQKNKYRTTTDKAKNSILKLARRIDEQEAAAKAAEAPEAPAEEVVEEKPSDPRLLTFLAAFGIIVREGLEAILVIAAIIAYLVKSGNGRSLKNVYIGAAAGVAASFVAAAVLAWAKRAFVGAGLAQEVIEGITALIAVCVLFYVSNWMISKAEAASWSRYIDGKVQSSVEQGSAFALAFTAFLSVFREGAEVVLFYQPMLSEGNPGMVWAGFGVGCVLLVFVYLAITKLSIKLPINVFFTATSILMAIMCVSFLGSGIKELAEGNVFDLALRVPGIPENDAIQVLGIYPYLETLLPQLILSIVLLVTFMIAHYRGKMDALRAEYAKN